MKLTLNVKGTGSSGPQRRCGVPEPPTIARAVLLVQAARAAHICTAGVLREEHTSEALRTLHYRMRAEGLLRRLWPMEVQGS